MQARPSKVHYLQLVNRPEHEKQAPATMKEVVAHVGGSAGTAGDPFDPDPPGVAPDPPGVVPDPPGAVDGTTQL